MTHVSGGTGTIIRSALSKNRIQFSFFFCLLGYFVVGSSVDQDRCRNRNRNSDGSRDRQTDRERERANIFIGPTATTTTAASASDRVNCHIAICAPPSPSSADTLMGMLYRLRRPVRWPFRLDRTTGTRSIADRLTRGLTSICDDFDGFSSTPTD